VPRGYWTLETMAAAFRIYHADHGEMPRSTLLNGLSGKPLPDYLPHWGSVYRVGYREVLVEAARARATGEAA
jgi:hypothetical protein